MSIYFHYGHIGQRLYLYLSNVHIHFQEKVKLYVCTGISSLKLKMILSIHWHFAIDFWKNILSPSVSYTNVWDIKKNTVNKRLSNFCSCYTLFVHLLLVFFSYICLLGYFFYHTKLLMDKILNDDDVFGIKHHCKFAVSTWTVLSYQNH